MTNVPPITTMQATAAEVAQASEEFARQRTKIANKKAQLVAFIATVFLGIIAVVALNIVGLTSFTIPRIYDRTADVGQYAKHIVDNHSGTGVTPSQTPAPVSTHAPAPKKPVSVAPVAPQAPAAPTK